MRFLLPILLATYALGCTQSARSTTPTHGAASINVEAIVSRALGRISSQEVISDFKAQRASVKTEHQAIIDELVLALGTNPDGDEKSWAAVSRILRDLSSTEPDDFTIQLAVTSYFQTELTGYANIGMNSAPRVEEEIKNSKELVKRFPGEARAFENLGKLQMLPSGDEVEALRAFKKCLELDASHTRCRDNYNVAASWYRLETCTQAQIHPQLAAYPASMESSKERVRSVLWKGEALHVATKPLIESSDVYKVVARGKKFRVDFTAKGITKLEKQIETQETVTEGLLMFAGDKALWSLLFGKFDAPRFIVLEGNVAMSELCADTQSRSLPEGLPDSL